MSSTRSSSLEARYRLAVIISGACAASILVYILLGLLIAKQQDPFSGFLEGQPFVGILAGILLAVGLSNFFVVPLVMKAVCRATSGDGGNGLLFGSIVGIALCEMPAVFGLVLFLLGGDQRVLYGFALLSWLLMALNFPRWEQWREWARNMEKEQVDD